MDIQEKLIWAIWGTLLIAVIALGFGMFAFYHKITKKLDQERICAISTERQAVQEKLDEAIRIVHIGALAGGAAEYLNLIMVAINGLVDMIAKGRSGTANMRALANQASLEAAEGLRITEQLQQFARVTQIRFDELSIKEVFDIVAAQGRLHGVILNAEGDEFAKQGGKVLGNGQFLERLFDLLLENANDATTESGVITLGFDIEGTSNLVIRVIDTGPGMDDDTQLRATDPFFSTKARPDRMGLGLSFALTLVKVHRGSMAIRSRLGQGCDIEIKFPIASAASLKKNAAKGLSIGEVLEQSPMSLEQGLNLIKQDIAQA